MRFLRIIFLILISQWSWAQSDTSKVFSYQDFYDLVVKTHPVLKQANTLPDNAKAELLMAKGAFDPKFSTSFDQKYFANTYYFNFWDSQLKVPIQTGGIDLKVGFERNVGQALGTDILTPPDGLTYFGIEIPVLQRLLIDQRRADLRNARVFQQIAEAERVKIINKLILNAAKAYWDWYFVYRNMTLTQEFYDLAAMRYDLVKKRVNQGDLPGLDSTDAQVTLLDRKVMLEQARVDFQNARLVLSNYLWSADGSPREIPDFAIPQITAARVIDEQSLSQLLELARQRHPEVQKLEFKGQQLQIDRQLAKNNMLPRLDFGVSSLNLSHRLITGYQGDNSKSNYPIIPNFYKFNADFSMPLFLRKERGKLQQVEVKQLQNSLEIKQIRREINNDITASYNDVKAFERQIREQQLAVERQTQLLRLEEMRFGIGESQLFLVNQREAKLNELRVKLESMKAKYEKAKATLLFAAGTSEW